MKNARIKAVVTSCDEQKYPYNMQVWYFFDEQMGWVYSGIGCYCIDEDEVRKLAKINQCSCIEWN